jgi:lysyl-tRNA synthetase class 2
VTSTRHEPSRGPTAAIRDRFTNTQAGAPRWLGNLAYLVGAIDLLTGLAHTWRVRLHYVTEVLPGALTNAAAAATVVSGLFLLLLAHSLKRRKRRAWRAAVGLLSLSMVLHAIKFEPVAVLLAAAGLALLVVHRSRFTALGDPTTRWRAVRVFAILFTASTAFGLLVIWGNDEDVVGGWPGWRKAASHVFLGFVGIDGGVHFNTDRSNDVLAALLLGLGLMTSLTTVYFVLRAPEPRPHLTPEDQLRLRALLDRHPDSLGYFKLLSDKSVIWSDTGKAAITYRVVFGVMLASGDPVGDPEAWPGAIKTYLCEAEEHAWTPAVLGCSELGGRVWVRETGFAALELGDEAIVDPAAFSLEGRAMRNVRQMVSRIKRAGYTTEILRVADASADMRREALADAAAWRSTDTERGFSMALGRVMDLADPDAVVVAARQGGRVRGFLQFVPWGEDGLSLDVMRRDRDADAGVNDLLIVEALLAAPALGVSRVSLNFAAFRSALDRGERLGAGPILRLWRNMLVFASRWFQIESLYRFNAKFQPHWQPRFVIYPGTRDLPRVGLAALEAEAFLVWPKLTWFGNAS